MNFSINKKVTWIALFIWSLLSIFIILDWPNPNQYWLGDVLFAIFSVVLWPSMALFIAFRKGDVEKFIGKITWWIIFLFNNIALILPSIEIIIKGRTPEDGLGLAMILFFGFFVFVGSVILGWIIYIIKNWKRK